MAQSDTPAAEETLQFDRAVNDNPTAGVPPTPVVECAGCKITIKTQYYDVNGKALCGTCRAAVAEAAETPRGMSTLMLSALFGLGAGIVGAGIYYAVIAIAHLEIGIVAILIGYMVGYSVRRGAQGRGGRRFQVLAAALTYFSVALAYAPLAVQQAMKDKAELTAVAPAATDTTVDVTPQAAAPEGAKPQARPKPSGARIAMSFVILGGIMIALPVLVVIGSMPSGLISAFIIFIGMRQAWKMTEAAVLKIHGPYRVGAAKPAIS
jgi:hypothetical protein